MSRGLSEECPDAPSPNSVGGLHTAPFRRPRFRRPVLLVVSLVLAGFAALSVHVGLLAAGAPFPQPRPPVWAQWLNEAFIVGALLAILKLAQPDFGQLNTPTRAIILFVIMAMVQETLRAAFMTGVVTGGWGYSALGLVKPLLRAFTVALLCVLALRWVQGIFSLLIVAVAIAALSMVVRRIVSQAVDPLLQHFAWLARADMYSFPYPFHVTVAAYLSFAEAVAGSLLLTMLVWDQLPASRPVRLLVLAVLVALVKGVVGSTLFYSYFTGESVLLGIISWSQFLLEFLVLGALVGLAWAAFGRQCMPLDGDDNARSRRPVA